MVKQASGDGDQALADSAEAVRAYLVAARGGAPLLSSADALVLRGWLVRGVRIGAIVRAIDLVAARRVAQRTRTPLSLTACRAEVEKQQKRAGAWVRAGHAVRVEPPAPDDPRFAALDALAAGALAELAALPRDDADHRARLACARAARFFDEAWERGPREALLADADTALGGSRALYDDAEWEAMRESMARDHLRRRYPLLTGTHIWEESYRGVE